jgi:hypothetical protein
MKNAIRLIIAVLMFVSAFAAVSAQDENVYIAPENTLGSLVLTTESGTFTENEDGTFTLTLNEVGDFASWVVVMPQIQNALYRTEQFAQDWAYDNEDISAEAYLALEDGATLGLTLTNIEIEDGTIAYNAELTSTERIEEGKSGLELPEAFNAASLVITLDEVFVSNFLTAHLERLSTTRNLQECFPVLCN